MTPVLILVFLAACLQSIASELSCTCPDDSWTPGSNHRCFKITSFHQSFKDAENFCINKYSYEKNGQVYLGHLASIHSREDHEQLLKMILDKPYYPHTRFFIGLTVDGYCPTWTDGTTFDYNFWHRFGGFFKNQYHLTLEASTANSVSRDIYYTPGLEEASSNRIHSSICEVPCSP